MLKTTVKKARIALWKSKSKKDRVGRIDCSLAALYNYVVSLLLKKLAQDKSFNLDTDFREKC